MSHVVVAATLIASGLATRYNPSVMDAVVANRVEWGDVDLSIPHVDYVALMDADHLGEQVWLELPDGRVSGPHLVVDCAARHHRAELKAKGFAVDLSFSLAQDLGVIDAPLAGVKVWDGDPRPWPELVE